MKKYDSAIVAFENIFYNEVGKSDRSLFLKEKSANWLYESHKAIGDIKKALFYKEEESRIQQKRKEFEQAAITRDIDIKYDVEGKQEELSKLKKLAKAFSRHRIIYGGVIFLTLLMAMYSILRWRTVDKRNKKLSELVLKKHIVLKDKIRIHLDELMYVESRKHHITLNCRDMKEIIRYPIGKLSGQLPPNFKRCHNSFIVNENYIRSISSDRILLKNGESINLSRKYKDNFKVKKQCQIPSNSRELKYTLSAIPNKQVSLQKSDIISPS